MSIKKKTVSMEAIEKIRALNKAHREAVANNNVEVIQRVSEEILIAEWLSKNTVTICPSGHSDSHHKMYRNTNVSDGIKL